MVIKRLLCAIGRHTYKTREIHACSEFPSKIFDSGIIQKCEVCGEEKITGEKMPTQLFVPDKYFPKEEKTDG